LGGGSGQKGGAFHEKELSSFKDCLGTTVGGVLKERWGDGLPRPFVTEFVGNLLVGQRKGKRKGVRKKGKGGKAQHSCDVSGTKL